MGRQESNFSQNQTMVVDPRNRDTRSRQGKAKEATSKLLQYSKTGNRPSTNNIPKP